MEEGKIIRRKEYEDRAPTKMCSICGMKEDPRANLVYGFAWICPECSERLKKLIYPNEGDVL